jgi:hypothetical protein
MALDVQRSREDLDQLKAELEEWRTPDSPGLNLWRHKLDALIGQILDPNHALAIQLAGLRWTADTTSARSRLDRKGLAGVTVPSGQSAFQEAKQSAGQIIQALRWELDRLAPATAPFADATIDPELWQHARGLIDAQDWEKVAREAAVFVEDKLRTWASVQAAVTGSVNVFKAAIGPTGFVLPKAGPSSEQQGWQQLATGFALALRNPSGHQINNRSDAKRYALGVLGIASLLLTQLRHEYGDPPKP